MADARVLVIGLDPEKLEDWDPEPILAAVARGQARFEEFCIESDLCLLDRANNRFVDTDLTAGLDIDKIEPAAVATSALDALEAGAPEAVVDDFSRSVKAGLYDDQQLLYPAVEAEFEATLSAAQR